MRKYSVLILLIEDKNCYVYLNVSLLEVYVKADKDEAET